MIIPNSLLALIHNISSVQAYEIIKNLGNPNVSVFSNGQMFNLSDLVKDESIRDSKAIDVGPFLFWGGSPTRLKYYQGSMYTLLCDRILDVIQAHGVQAVREVITTTPTRVRVRV